MGRTLMLNPNQSKYKSLLFELYEVSDKRLWTTFECECSRKPCYSLGVMPKVQKDDDDWVVGSGEVLRNDAEFLVLAHNILLAWANGRDTPEQWEKLKELNQNAGPTVKWRYQHCFAVRKKKYQQDSCWCREIVAVGIIGNKRYVVEGGKIRKNEAVLMTLMHNYLLEKQ
jgi:hypothetical protein